MKTLKPSTGKAVAALAVALLLASSATRAAVPLWLWMLDAFGDVQVASQPAAGAQGAPRNLAIFIFDGVQIIDYTGPYEVLGQAHDGRRKLFNVYTVAEKPGPVTTNMGMTVVPKYTFDDMPKTDVLVLPGGRVGPHMENAKVIKWVQETASRAEYVMSVCNGAFYLGKAGLLDGLQATTFYGMIDDLKELAPKARVVSDQRFADNGKIITTAGLSSGIDGALHLVERVAGRGYAQEVALNMEYNWQPDSGYARASFADRHLRKIVGRGGFKLPEGAGWTVLGQRGGRDEWEKEWEVRLATTPEALLKIVDAKLAEGWAKAPSRAAAGGAARTLWKFTDEEGKAWNAVSRVEPSKGTPGAFKLSIRLARGDLRTSAKLE
ncbi:MAG TPA: DJ-1/PfpI family protein [Pyrinomonadaceae bacterium]|jgi:putative intracellular protease/amidase|nr:DJ-1/PfpI family protein [Pyrinomonadaceae bacterium]